MAIPFRSTRVGRTMNALCGLLLGGSVLAACTSPIALPCHSDVDVGPVPEWASAGFSPGATVPHVIGHSGRILAVLFSDPLIANPDGQLPRNKVLLVSRAVPQGPEPVTIDARLSGTDVTVQRVRSDGPGPGVLDMPKPGCWNLTLHWGNQSDSLDLEYQGT
jgi:hypothetical protein